MYWCCTFLITFSLHFCRLCPLRQCCWFKVEFVQQWDHVVSAPCWTVRLLLLGLPSPRLVCMYPPNAQPTWIVLEMCFVMRVLYQICGVGGVVLHLEWWQKLADSLLPAVVSPFIPLISINIFFFKGTDSLLLIYLVTESIPALETSWAWNFSR